MDADSEKAIRRSFSQHTPFPATPMIFPLIIPVFALFPFFFITFFTDINIPLPNGLPSALPCLYLPPGPLHMAPTPIPITNSLVSDVPSSPLSVNNNGGLSDETSLSVLRFFPNPEAIFDANPVVGCWFKLLCLFVIIPIIGFALGYWAALAWDSFVSPATIPEMSSSSTSRIGQPSPGPSDTDSARSGSPMPTALLQPLSALPSQPLFHSFQPLLDSRVRSESSAALTVLFNPPHEFATTQRLLLHEHPHATAPWEMANSSIPEIPGQALESPFRMNGVRWRSLSPESPVLPPSHIATNIVKSESSTMFQTATGPEEIFDRPWIPGITGSSTPRTPGVKSGSPVTPTLLLQPPNALATAQRQPLHERLHAMAPWETANSSIPDIPGQALESPFRMNRVRRRSLSPESPASPVLSLFPIATNIVKPELSTTFQTATGPEEIFDRSWIPEITGPSTPRTPGVKSGSPVTPTLLLQPPNALATAQRLPLHERLHGMAPWEMAYSSIPEVPGQALGSPFRMNGVRRKSLSPESPVLPPFPMATNIIKSELSTVFQTATGPEEIFDRSLIPEIYDPGSPFTMDWTQAVSSSAAQRSPMTPVVAKVLNTVSQDQDLFPWDVPAVRRNPFFRVRPDSPEPPESPPKEEPTYLMRVQLRTPAENEAIIKRFMSQFDHHVEGRKFKAVLSPPFESTKPYPKLKHLPFETNINLPPLSVPASPESSSSGATVHAPSPVKVAAPIKKLKPSKIPRRKTKKASRIPRLRMLIGFPAISFTVRQPALRKRIASSRIPVWNGVSPTPTI